MTCHGCCSWGCHLNHRIMHRPQHTHKARFGWYKYISKTTIKILYNVIYNTRFTRCKNLYNLTNRKYFCVKCDYVNQLSWIITFLDYNDKIIRQQKLIQSKYLHLAKCSHKYFDQFSIVVMQTFIWQPTVPRPDPSHFLPLVTISYHKLNVKWDSFSTLAKLIFFYVSTIFHYWLHKNILRCIINISLQYSRIRPS